MLPSFSVWVPRVPFSLLYMLGSLDFERFSFDVLALQVHGGMELHRRLGSLACVTCCFPCMR
jgi:hypothetical protein